MRQFEQDWLELGSRVARSLHYQHPRNLRLIEAAKAERAADHQQSRTTPSHGRGHMPDTTTTIVGNLTDDPEVRYIDGEIARAVFRVAVNGRREQKPSFFTVIVWRGQAEHAAESLAKGSRVVVVGPFDRKAAARIASGHGQGQDRLHGAANGLSPRHRGLQQR
jgi:hypothetical protein